MNPAVRHPTGQCIEEADCDWEKATLCGWNSTAAGYTETGSANTVAFLACLDGKTGDALKAAAACASASKVDMTATVACFNGDLGQQLLTDASVVWNKAFPDRATVPHIFVNGANVAANYADIKTAVCKAAPTAKGC
jgi:hypothetical protein